MALRTALRYWLPPLLWTAVIFAASSDFFSSAHTGSWLNDIIRSVFGRSLPEPQFGELHYVIRKSAHVGEYGILGALLFRALRAGETLSWRAWWAAGAICIAAAVGSADEFHQIFVPSRTPSPWDVLIDTGGAALAQVIIRLVTCFSP